MPCDIAVGHQRADAQPAILGLLDFVEREPGDIDQSRRKLHMLLDEVDQVGAAGDELRARVGCDPPHGVCEVGGARIFEIVHRVLVAECWW